MKRVVLSLAISVLLGASTAFPNDVFTVGYDLPDEAPGVGVEAIIIHPNGLAELGRIEAVLIQFSRKRGTWDVAGWEDFDGLRTTYKIPDEDVLFIPRHPEKYGLAR